MGKILSLLSCEEEPHLIYNTVFSFLNFLELISTSEIIWEIDQKHIGK